LERIESQFGPDGAWRFFQTQYELKRQLNQEEKINPFVISVLRALNSGIFVRFLEKLTQIDHLIPDPHFVGAGLHELQNGGRLGVHVDFNKHKSLPLYRRLNVIVYLNRGWSEKYGGLFEFWDEHRNACVKSYLPEFNRMVVFSTTKKSFHGNPVSVNCPQGRTRKSIAMFYYSVHPGLNVKRFRHYTVFLNATGKREAVVGPYSLRSVIRYLRARLRKVTKRM